MRSFLIATALFVPVFLSAQEIPVEVRGDSSFAFGYQMGSQFMSQFGNTGLKSADIDLDRFYEGVKKGIDQKELSKEEEKRLGDALEALQGVLQERAGKVSAEHLEKGKKFLEENKKKEGVKTTASGLQYEVLTEGTGPCYEGDGSDNPTFMVRYEGRFIDGKKFDGDMKAEPVPFTLQVVPGFQEALKAMPKGSKWRLYLAPELGYGAQGAGGVIPPNTVLIFDLELVDFSSGAPKAP